VQEISKIVTFSMFILHFILRMYSFSVFVLEDNLCPASSLVLDLEHDFVLAVEELHGAVIASGEVRAGVQRIYTIS